MNESIFPAEAQGLDATPWSEWLEDLTPVEVIDGVWVKREDAFAPLGFGGINGSKLRGLIMMMSSFDSRVVTAASVRSPQHGMTAAVAAHLSMPCLNIVGATNPRSAAKHVQPQIAARFGAQFEFIGGAYNSSLQPRAKQRAFEIRAAVVPYGITPEPFEHERFHSLGGLQTVNLPDVGTLIVPTGSCNSLLSVLYGLHHNPRPTSLRRVVCVGIGPEKIKMTWERMGRLGIQGGYRYNAETCLKRDPIARNYLELVYVDAFQEYSYDQLVKQKLGDLVLHPTYEAKVVRYLRDHHPHLLSLDSCLWIVGGPQSEEAMEPHFLHPHFEELPTWTQ